MRSTAQTPARQPCRGDLASRPYAITTFALRLLAFVALPCVVVTALALGLGRVLPHGGQIAYLSSGNLNLMDLSRGLIFKLTNLIVQFGPSWSPDGEKIFFVAYADNSIGSYVLDVDEGKLQRLTDNQTLAAFPTYLPDGRHIAFLRVSAQDISLYEMDSDGNNQRQLFGNVTYLLNMDLHWSSDGEHFAFSTWDERSSNIYLVDADGNYPQQLTGDDSAEEMLPLWLPDGEHIAYLSTKDRINYEVFVMDTTGRDYHRVTEVFGLDGIPETWSPNGQQIVFTSYRDGDQELYLISVNSGEARRLTWNNVDDYRPSWRPS